MKKRYERPLASVEVFRANEYVAAYYKIKCTTPNNNARFNYLYEDTNKDGVWDKNQDKLIYNNGGTFLGCNNWHKGVIKSEAPSINGFVVKETWQGLKRKYQSYPVFYWKEHFGNGTVDYHVMTPGRENYETNPNAS